MAVAKSRHATANSMGSSVQQWFGTQNVNLKASRAYITTLKKFA